jgi:uncharacterized membrane protein YfhO
MHISLQITLFKNHYFAHSEFKKIKNLKTVSTERLKLTAWIQFKNQTTKRMCDFMRTFLALLTLRGDSKWLAVSRELEYPIWAAGTLPLRKV